MFTAVIMVHLQKLLRHGPDSQSRLQKSSLSYFLYHQQYVSESPVKIHPAVPEIRLD